MPSVRRDMALVGNGRVVHKGMDGFKVFGNTDVSFFSPWRQNALADLSTPRASPRLPVRLLPAVRGGKPGGADERVVMSVWHRSGCLGSDRAPWVFLYEKRG
jgi:hypothetical protein